MDRFLNVGVGVINSSAEISWKSTVIVSSIGSIASFLLGAWNLPLRILLALVILDYASGTLKAWYLGKTSSKKGYSSKVGAVGLAKKASIFLIVAVAQLSDSMLGLDFLRNATCIAYAINEAFSICENASQMGVYVPTFIKDRLAQAQEEVEDIGNSKDKQKLK